MPYKNKEDQKAYEAVNKTRIRSNCLKRRYGITLEQFDDLFKKQGSRCRICKSVEPGGKGWCVDHDHRFRASKVLRGILCNNCNRMLGYAKDQESILFRAAVYLSLQYVA